MSDDPLERLRELVAQLRGEDGMEDAAEEEVGEAPGSADDAWDRFLGDHPELG